MLAFLVSREHHLAEAALQSAASPEHFSSSIVTVRKNRQVQPLGLLLPTLVGRP